MKKSTKKVVMKKNAKRMLIFGFFSLAAMIFVFGSVFTVVDQIMAKYREADELEEKMMALEKKEEELNNEILKLQDPSYLAGYAREKYFYSKDGELIIRIPNDNE